MFDFSVRAVGLPNDVGNTSAAGAFDSKDLTKLSLNLSFAAGRSLRRPLRPPAVLTSDFRLPTRVTIYDVHDDCPGRPRGRVVAAGQKKGSENHQRRLHSRLLCAWTYDYGQLQKKHQQYAVRPQMLETELQNTATQTTMTKQSLRLGLPVRRQMM